MNITIFKYYAPLSEVSFGCKFVASNNILYPIAADAAYYYHADQVWDKAYETVLLTTFVFYVKYPSRMRATLESFDLRYSFKG